VSYNDYLNEVTEAFVLKAVYIRCVTWSWVGYDDLWLVWKLRQKIQSSMCHSSAIRQKIQSSMFHSSVSRHQIQSAMCQSSANRQKMHSSMFHSSANRQKYQSSYVTKSGQLAKK